MINARKDIERSHISTQRHGIKPIRNLLVVDDSSRSILNAIIRTKLVLGAPGHKLEQYSYKNIFIRLSSQPYWSYPAFLRPILAFLPIDTGTKLRSICPFQVLKYRLKLQVNISKVKGESLAVNTQNCVLLRLKRTNYSWPHSEATDSFKSISDKSLFRHSFILRKSAAVRV